MSGKWNIVLIRLHRTLVQLRRVLQLDIALIAQYKTVNKCNPKSRHHPRGLLHIPSKQGSALLVRILDWAFIESGGRTLCVCALKDIDVGIERPHRCAQD